MSRFTDTNRGLGSGRGGYGQGAQNSYSNGYGNSGINPYADDTYGPRSSARDPASPVELNNGPPIPGRARDRRQGGYGQPLPPIGGSFPRSRDNLIEEERAHVNRPTSLERASGKRRSDGTPWSQRSPTRKQHTGNGSTQIEQVILGIQREWEFMTDEKCVPVEIALKLMDGSTLGLQDRYEQFKDVHEQLQTALKAIVNEHHQGFNSSIGTFHSIQLSIKSSQDRLRGLRDSLVQAKTSLATTKPELKGLATSSQDYDDMLKVLGSIEHLQGIPEKLEARISEKRFLSAVELLQDALKTMRNHDMDEIGALSDLRVYLSNQEHSLTDILVEELHNHLYLKSPYCEHRWKAYAPQHLKANGVDAKEPVIGVKGRPLFYFLDKVDTSIPMQDDPNRNPEADTFMYIQLLVESLNGLGRLDVAVNTITERLPTEMFKVVDKCSNEADQRHPSTLRGSKNGRDVLDGTTSARSIVLNDLLGALYARFEAIAEGHRVVHEVISGILKREGLRTSSSLTGGFRELWKLYQSEIKSLLHDYLAADGNLAFGRGQANDRGIGIFSRQPRDKTKKMFKLTDMDKKSSDLTVEREDLEGILKSSVPGLVSEPKRTEATIQETSNAAIDGSATGHKLLVEPSVFNMGILLPPSLAFLQRLKEVVPQTSEIALSTLTSFLDDFLINVFLPQLEETLAELCAQTFAQNDAFQQDSQWASHSKKPIFKGTHTFFTLITAFCRMLDNLPHDQAFTHLIINQMMAYYEKCHIWLQTTIARPHPHPVSGKMVKMSAALMEDGPIKDVVIGLTHADDEGKETLIEQETDLLINSVSELPIEEVDLIVDRRNIALLCSLATSMRWLGVKIKGMRHISNLAVDSSRRESNVKNQRRWTLIGNADKGVEDGRVYLPLSSESAVEFDGVVESFGQLAESVVRILHVEIRNHVTFYLGQSMKRSFLLPNEVYEPDEQVLKLNADLVAFDEELAEHLLPSQQRFITSHLAIHHDKTLLSLFPTIPSLNFHGYKHLQLSITVLQQNLKNIDNSQASLSRSDNYLKFFELGPEELIRKAKEATEGGTAFGYTFEQGKKIIDLFYSEAEESSKREVSVQARRSREARVLELNEWLY
ncbi:hypothetical protein FKW77_005111 [Venturia effusa]|uniref:Exocyst complex component Sec8 n=1 Tax=Venturia effusa TaxID=50376 RepID=A0A517L380_9PEZI|nr:hypothetical protein FKW77_005111 [Venturia effusa]